MLDVLRKRRRSWVITFFLGVIVFVFVLWGVGSIWKQPRLDSVAEVNGENISLREFEAHYLRLIEFYRDLFRGKLTEQTIQSLNLKKIVLDELVQKHLLLQEARRLGLGVGEEELMNAIARVPEFQIAGRFSPNRYRQLLASKRLTPAQFETEERSQLTIKKLLSLVQDSTHVTEAEVRQRHRWEQEKINLYFIRLSAGDFMSQAKASMEEIKGTYEKNQEALREPSRVQAEYLRYPWAHFSSKVQVSGKEVEEFYKIHRETRFHQPGAVRVRHILFRIPAGADAKQREMFRLKAERVLQEARAGRDFARLAREHSEDPSAAQGGDVGFFSQGQMLPPLDKVAFSLKKGEIGSLVETSLGYHILKIEETREERTRRLEEVSAEIVRQLKEEKGRIEAGKAADRDREKALSGTDLSQLARGRGLRLVLSPFFSLSEVVEGVGPVEDFNKTAFSLPLHELGPVIEGPQAYYLLRVKQRKEPSIASFDSVRSRLEKELREKKAFELATQKANSLLGELKQENDLRKLGRRYGLKVEETGWFPRNVTQIPKVGVLQEIQPGGIPLSSRQPVPDKIFIQKDAVYLFAFKESQEVNMERFEKEKARLLEQALNEKKEKAIQKFMDSLIVKARIQIRPEFSEGS